MVRDQELPGPRCLPAIPTPRLEPRRCRHQRLRPLALWCFSHEQSLSSDILGKQHGNIRVAKACYLQRLHAFFDAGVIWVNAEYGCVFTSHGTLSLCLIVVKAL